MTEEIAVYHKDMETYLEPDEYQAFLKAKGEMEAYFTQRVEYEKKKADAEWFTAEYQKNRDEAKTGIERTLWNARVIVSTAQAGMPAPYEPSYYFHEHDRYIELVRERKVEKARQEAEKKRRLAAQKEREERARLAQIEEQARQKRADKECQEFLHQTNQTVKTFKKQLTKRRKPKFSYPACLVSYHPETWCEPVLPGKDDVNKWAEPYILEQVPESLRDFVSWELDYEVKMLPRADYRVVGVLPCLVWHFTVLLLIKVQLRLVEKKFTRIFCGYEHPLKMTHEKLGLLYLGPIKWGDDQEGFVIPVGLLFVLAQGKKEAPGIVVHCRSSPFTTFTVEGFDGGVDVHDDFRRFMSKIGCEELLGVALRVQGITDKETAVLLEDKAKLLLPLQQPVGAQASAVETSVGNSDVLSALQSMGFKTAESKKAIEAAHLSPAMSLEEKVKAVLKILGA
jgi:cell division protein FtsN